MKKNEWWVDGPDLKEPTRSGGSNALKGFDFQKAYALLRTVWLLSSRGGLVEVRYEGAQDVDLRHGDEIQLYVQAKDYQWGGLTLQIIYDALAGFTRDVISAKKNGCSDQALPKFHLLTTTVPIDQNSLQLYRGVSLARHIPLIAKRIKTKYRNGLNEVQVKACVKTAFERTTFESVLAKNICTDLRALASWELVRFGVPLESVDASLGRIENLLNARATLQIEDVAAVLENLPDGHPARTDGATQMIPSRNLLANSDVAKSMFLRGAAPALWAAIANNLDIERKELNVIQQKLGSLVDSGGLLLIEGVAGAGKSTVAKRVAWQAHRSGIFLVLNVSFPAEMQAQDWKAILRLCEFSETPVLLVVDDVWRHPTFIDDLDRNVRSRLCVLGTSRPGEQPATQPIRLIVDKVKLGKLGDSELNALSALVKTTANIAPSFKKRDLRALLNSGQIFAASLVLQNGSLEEFAKSLAHPLRSTNAALFDDFLSFCICAMHDQAVPIELLHKIRSGSSSFWESEQYKDLVFQTSRSDTTKLRIGHALVATAIVRECNVSAVSRALDICRACSPENNEERRFAIRLLNNCASDDVLLPECKAQRNAIAEVFEKYESAATYSDLHRISAVFKRLDENSKVKHYRNLATVQRIRDSEDIRVLFTSTLTHSFAEVFDAALKFYESNDTANGRRKFLATLMAIGDIDQKRRVADHMKQWVRKQEFPQEETRLLFDLCTYAGRDLAKHVLPEVEAYAQAKNVSLDTILAALRVITRTRDMASFNALHERILLELSQVSSYGETEIEVATKLSRLSSKMGDINQRRELYEKLLAIYSADTKNNLKIRILRSALHLAPESEIKRLLPFIEMLKDKYSNHQKTPRSAADCIGLFQRLTQTQSLR